MNNEDNNVNEDNVNNHNNIMQRIFKLMEDIGYDHENYKDRNHKINDKYNNSCSSSNCKTTQRNRKELFFVALPKRQNNVARSYFLLLCQGDKEMFRITALLD